MSNDNAPVPNPTLRHAVTSVALSLTLTRNQLLVLDAVARGSRETGYSYWVPTAWQLKRRGLVLHVTDPEGWGGLLSKPDNLGRTRAIPGSGDALANFYRLTRAGWLVHDLCAEAGMVEAISERKLRKVVAA